MVWKKSDFGFWLRAQGGFDRGTWEKGRRGMDYVEDESMVDEPREVTWWQWLDFSALGEIMVILIVALLVGILVFILYKSGRRGKGNRKTPKAIAVEKSEPAPRESVSIEALRAAYERARAEGRFRDALHFLFHIALAKLNIKGFPPIGPDQTNREYLLELSDSMAVEDFARLTHLHEMSWYGSKHLSEMEFESIAGEFMHFMDEGDAH